MIQLYNKFLILLFLIINFALNSSAQNLKKVFDDAEKQTTFIFGQIDQAKEAWLQDIQNKKKPEVVSPRNLSPEGNLNLVAAKDSTSRFFPGVLWFLYEFTENQEWEKQASRLTANIENEKMNCTTHEVGFKIYGSFGAGYRLTKDPKYKEIILPWARTLSNRFRPIVGCIRS